MSEGKVCFHQKEPFSFLYCYRRERFFLLDKTVLLGFM
ncbi:hypothetical protein SD77_1493 [Bacillus badius]|uniref:Uncharacterized protein n=1 Tax=Bacillus badius TaxID=1455 RepID=A0ABR5ARX9_BACBA|nr:hypothetical protein SD78_3151 [Bacillus badius]KIL77507.1 hypothetical protein SD77_1493 [Bacillus badius]